MTSDTVLTDVWDFLLNFFAPPLRLLMVGISSFASLSISFVVHIPSFQKSSWSCWPFGSRSGHCLDSVMGNHIAAAASNHMRSPKTMCEELQHTSWGNSVYLWHFKAIQEWKRHCLSAGGYLERKMQNASPQSTESPRAAWKDVVAPAGAGSWVAKSPWHLSHSFSLAHFIASSTLQRSTSSTQLMAQHQNPSKGGDSSYQWDIYPFLNFKIFPAFFFP